MKQKKLRFDYPAEFLRCLLVLLAPADELLLQTYRKHRGKGTSCKRSRKQKFVQDNVDDSKHTVASR